MPVCTCPCPLHSAEGTFDVDGFWSSVTGGSPKLDNTIARLVFMGDGRVGTSSLIKRFIRGLFESDYKPEVAKVMRHTKTVYANRLATEVIVQFWDIEGSDVKTALLCAQKAHAVAVVYDITNRSSFELAQRLLDGVNPRASVILIAHKSDLKEQRKVSYQEGRLLGKIHRVEYLEVSSKVNSKVDQAFTFVIDSVPEQYLRGGSRDSSALVATRRWQTSANSVLCAKCKAFVPSETEDSEADVVPARLRSVAGVRLRKERSVDVAQARRLNTRRRVRSDPECDSKSVSEKSVSI